MCNHIYDDDDDEPRQRLLPPIGHVFKRPSDAINTWKRCEVCCQLRAEERATLHQITRDEWHAISTQAESSPAFIAAVQSVERAKSAMHKARLLKAATYGR